MLKTNYKTKNPLFLLDRSIARFHSHGELINETHLINLVNIALHNPHCNFALWTKRFDIISKYFKKNKKPSRK